MSEKKTKKIVVIGGGPAGMMAAYAATLCGCRVILLEKNEKLGKKLYITGKGRCNVTNAGELEDIRAHVMNNPKFLYSALYSFDNQAVMNFMEEHGVPLKVERGNRVFPVSDHSSDIIAACSRALKEKGVEVCLGCEALSLIVRENRCVGVSYIPAEFGTAGSNSRRGRKTVAFDVKPVGKAASFDAKSGKKAAALNNVRSGSADRGDDTSLMAVVDVIDDADRVIVATGGLSYSSTGSTGDGYLFAEQTGHGIVSPTPSLVPLTVREDWVRRLQGLSLRNAGICICSGKKKLYEDFGEMLFTHFGVSGPMILSASAAIRPRYFEKPLELYIDLKPAIDEETLDKRLLREFDQSRNKAFKNAVSGLFPGKLTPVIVEISGIDPEKKVCEVTKEERRSFAELIKRLPMTVTGKRDFNEAIITKGGVSVKDVDPSTMHSKRTEGLSFCGEVLDLDAATGGYNLQIAWSTGYLAGISV